MNNATINQKNKDHVSLPIGPNYKSVVKNIAKLQQKNL